MKNSMAHICALLLLSAGPVFSAGPDVDFDQKNKGTKDIKIFIGENTSVIFPKPTNKTDSNIKSKCETLTETGEWVELKPVESWIDERGTKYNQYTFFPGSRIRWTLRCNQGKWTAKETYSFQYDEFGGHSHYDPPPPALSVSSVTLSTSMPPAFYSTPSPIIFPEMKGSTTYYYWESLPLSAMRVVEQFESSGACHSAQTNYLDVKVSGLIKMPEGQNYILNNPPEAAQYHYENNYGTQKLIDTLKTIADGYKAAFPNAAPLEIYDMSLSWGGLFDINHDWKTPHYLYGHFRGLDADINKMAVPQENRQKLLEIMCRTSTIIYSEQDVQGEIPHYYHVWVSTDKNGFLPDNFGKESERLTITSCCKGNEIDPANLQICVSTQTPAAWKP